MSRITLNTFNQLKAVATKQFNYYIEFSEANDTWQRAVYYNKLQNQFIKDDEPGEVVQSIQLYDEETKSVKHFSVRAKKQYSRLQWFTLLLGASLCTYSRQQLNAVLNN